MVINDIELKRKDLIQTAIQFGLNSIKTIERSQELDILLIQEIKCNYENHPISEKK